MQIYRLDEKKEKIYIWGTGNNAVLINERFNDILKNLPIAGYIDNNIYKQHSFFYGKEVYSPSILKEKNDGFIYISVADKSEIINQIYKEYSGFRDKIIEDNFFQRAALLTRYGNSTDDEIGEIISFLGKNELSVFNYEYTKKYKQVDIEIYEENNFFYTIRNGRKLYFSKRYNSYEKAKSYYISLLLEQDEKSPHRYLSKEFDIPKDAVVIDAGAAEGIFALDILDRCKKIYLFEPDEDWQEALKLTFADSFEKVEIIGKSVSNFNDEKITTIDTFVNEEKIDFIKLDIEGEEYYALMGAREVINRSPHIKCVVCTYHQEFAYAALSELLNELKFRTSFSRGYMWVPYGHFIENRYPVLRRGLLYASK